MRIWIIRHADPDYEHDSLTPKGWKEAELLAERLKGETIDYCYVSPLGRAKDTAATALKYHRISPVEKSWLREFPPAVPRPVAENADICWDWLPEEWAGCDIAYSKDKWVEFPFFKNTAVYSEYSYVIGEFDKLLAEHGYVWNGNWYDAVEPNRDTIAIFCHFGLESVLLSRLLGVSPMIVWMHMVAAPSSVTTLTTEERRSGIALFRMQSFGDIGHLYMNCEKPSFAARFCETFKDNHGERVD